MDARIDGVGVTPRIGKAVEINAMWVNGLAALRAPHARLGGDAPEITALHERAHASFATRFPRPGGGLYDVVDGPAGDDDAVRPNQLVAFSLPYAPLTAPGALGSLTQALLTPLGLRSLAPGSPGYRGQHRGGPRDRDSAYHQGTVWPWLIGPYFDTCRHAGARTDGVLASLTAHLAEWGLGSISETADGDPPHCHRLSVPSLVGRRTPARRPAAGRVSIHETPGAVARGHSARGWWVAALRC